MVACRSDQAAAHAVNLGAPFMTQPIPLQRIAILGGGMAALSAAYGLVREQESAGQPLYEITLYQLG